MKKQTAKRFLYTLLINSSVFLTLLFFSPMEIFIGNVNDLHFNLSVVWWMLLIGAVLFSFVLSIIENLLLPKKALRFVNLTVAAVSICFYVQSLFLNGNMGSLLGDKDSYSASVIIINLIIWAALLFAVIDVYYLLKKNVRKTYFSAVSFVCAAIIIMQSVGVISLVSKGIPESSANKDIILSKEGELTLSEKGKNVLYFIIDTCDGSMVTEALNDNPDLFADFDGFTYYPNALSVHTRTYPSVPYLLTGKKCFFDMPISDYVAEAYYDSTFLPDMKALNTDVRLFTELDFIQSDSVDNLTECDVTSAKAVDIAGLYKMCLKMSLYKTSPYFAKAKFFYTSAEINKKGKKDNVQNAVYEDDLAFYDLVKSEGVKLSDNYENTFRFYHLYGTHPGSVINRNAEFEENASRSEVLMGDLKIIAEYLKQIKKKGVYDNTTVIITADHGYTAASDDLRLHSAYTPIMLVKPANAENKKCETSLAPVSHEDLFATVIDGLGGNYEKYGKRIFDYSENENRTRLHYYTALCSDIDGEVALREYAVSGDARDFANWSLTGNNWDINFSHRAVSEKRLSDLEK